MNRALRSFVFALLAFAAGTWLLCSPRQEGPVEVSAPVTAPSTSAPASPSQPAAAATVSTPDRAPPAPRGKGFRSPQRLADHFDKHGREFAAPTADAYLALAQALRDAPVGGDVREIVRPADGVISRFDRRTGAFLAVDPDGTIRTFFKPNDGEAYFERQARRLPR